MVTAARLCTQIQVRIYSWNLFQMWKCPLFHSTCKAKLLKLSTWYQQSSYEDAIKMEEIDHLTGRYCIKLQLPEMDQCFRCTILENDDISMSNEGWVFHIPCRVLVFASEIVTLGGSSPFKFSLVFSLNMNVALTFL